MSTWDVQSATADKARQKHRMMLVIVVLMILSLCLSFMCIRIRHICQLLCTVTTVQHVTQQCTNQVASDNSGTRNSCDSMCKQMMRLSTQDVQGPEIKGLIKDAASIKNLSHT